MPLKRILTGFPVRAAQALRVAAALPSPGKRRGVCSNRKAWKRGSLLKALTARGFTLGFALLILFALLLGAVSTAQAGTVSCKADYGGVIDGNNFTPLTLPSSIQIDGNCTFQNFPRSAKWPDGLTSTINFYFDGFLVVFDNVYLTGHIACANTTDLIWFSNSENYGSNNACQDLFIPIEKIDKQSPAPYAAIGVPFTYKLTIPVLFDPVTGKVIPSHGSMNELHSIIVTDDLNLNATGADLTYLSHVAYWQDTTTPVPHTFSNTGGVLTFDFGSLQIPAGRQIIIDITVVLNDTPANVAGTQFSNTAKWEFGRYIDGVFYQPLPGEWGISQPMTIIEPNLTLTKTGSVSTANLDSPVIYTLNVQNTGGSDAWNTTITDNIPAGMCTYDPRSTVTARIFASDGVTPVSGPLANGTDFSLTWNGGSSSACQLGLQMLSDAAKIGPTQRLIITYQARIDSTGVLTGTPLTNIAGATKWFSADSSNAGRRKYDRILTDGTPGVLDFQDAYTVTAALAGYYFQKTVRDLTTGTYPATEAFPGDRLHYTLLLQNFTWPALNGITITDNLPTGVDSISNVTITPAGGSISVTQPGGGSPGSITITGLNLPAGLPNTTQIQIDFDVTLASNLTDGSIVSNQASLNGIDSNGTPWSGPSDDPFNGTVLLGSGGDPTRVTIRAPGALSKANTQSTATIGQQFSYLITVPAPTNVSLYDVQIRDTLPTNADVSVVGAELQSGSTWIPLTVTGTGTSTDPLVIRDLTTGIDIPAGGQAVIRVTVALQNTTTNHNGVSFTNSASYTYNKVNGGGSSTQGTGAAGSANMSVIEPHLTATKAVSYASPPGQAITVPANAGDVLQYTLTVTNNGTSEAFDSDVIDTLPANVQLYGTPTARINGVTVSGFVPTPATSATVPSLPSGTVAWGSQYNNDRSLDIPINGTLVLTYQVQVLSVNGAPLTNTAWAAWTSLDNVIPGERTGAGCPNVTSPNIYCSDPASATPVPTVDPTTIAKSVVSDSWDTGLSTSSDKILRIGDTVVYQLALSLRSGQLQNVQITDQLAPGLAFDSVVSINGDTTAPYSSSGVFSYTDISAANVPTAGQTGTLTWTLGNITNNSTTTSPFVIQYRARVVTNTLTQQPTTNLGNNVTLAYTGSAVPPSSANITVWQPIMSTPTKTDRAGRTSPAQVNVTTDTMQFRLESCNNGTAPAYSVKFTDLLASQLNQTTITPPAVRVGGTLLTAGTDYTYTPPAGRGGTMTFVLNTPVNPGQCVTIDYNIGFYTDFGPNQTWNNSVTLDEYWSLPLQSGQRYGALGPAIFTMTNSATISQPSKTLQAPASGEATIGDEVVYRITVPTTPINAALYDVTVTDTLNSSLVYLGATDVSGNNFTLTDNSVAPGQVNLTIAQIPAGKQATIEVHARVANNSDANAGLSFQNSASYMYADTVGGAKKSGGTGTTAIPLRIIEPVVTLTKSVSNLTKPGVAPTVGDILRYTLVFQAAGGSTTDTYSSAFDLSIAEALTLGLAYNGNVTVSGAGNTISAPIITGDGINTPQSLSWGLPSSNIDIPEGTSVTVSYEAMVLNNVQSGQTLIASTTAQWTGQNGVNNYERTGSGTPVVNDYFLGPVAASMITQLPVLNFTKTVYNVTTGQSGATARPGDTLKYTLTIQNRGPVGATNFSLTDELDRLNSSAMFVPGSLTLLTVPAGATTSLTSATGGAKGTGLVSIGNLSIDGQSSTNPNPQLVIEFQARLVPVITNGTNVLNQAQIGSSMLPTQLSDDPSLGGTTDPTLTRITSAPAFRVLKTVQDITSGTATVMAGDKLRYTITVRNIGTENAIGVRLRDLVPANTSYVANSTRLNGIAVADPSAGVSALQNGMLINSPANPTAGVMPADASAAPANTATITFDVQISTNVVDGTIISNQGFVNGSGADNVQFPEQPSDNPATPVLNDPTTVVVGNLPLVYALKTVRVVDNNSDGVVDSGDVLHYTITLTNTGATPATGVVLTDAVPQYTTYVPGTVTLNGIQVADLPSGSPLASGMAVSSSNLTPPLPAPGAGMLSPGASAVVTFDVQVNAGVPSASVPPGTLISNQGSVATAQLPMLMTDADGNSSNGYQPTVVAIGDAQQLAIVKSAVVVGGGAALPGSVLEYTIQVTNIGTVPATNVVLTDAVPQYTTYLPGTVTLNGIQVADLPSGSPLASGMAVSSSNLTPPLPAAGAGTVSPGGSAVIRFHVRINSNVAAGTTVTNTASVSWNSPDSPKDATASVNLGAIPGSAGLSGRVWHDANLNKLLDSGSETGLQHWSVGLYRNNQLIATQETDANGAYSFSGLVPNVGTPYLYELRFRAPGAGPNTASMGQGDSPFTNGPQRISAIIAGSGANLQNVNLPLQPNGVVYNSVRRGAVAGARLALLNAATNAPLPTQCFDDPVQQNQVTAQDGFYKFDLNFSDASSCPAGGKYLIQVTPPATGYTAGPSQIIRPASDATTAAFSVPTCPDSTADAVTGDAYCEVTTSPAVPSGTAGTVYYLHLLLSNGNVPGQSQIFNNPIPVDPVLGGAVAITKVAAKMNVTRGELVPYTITVTNLFGAPLDHLAIVDNLPGGFKYVAHSARLDGNPKEPEPSPNRRQLTWSDKPGESDLYLGVNGKHTIKFLLVVGSGVSEGEYINRAQAFNTATGLAVSGQANATVRVIPDPTFDCTDVIGKVFDDRNLNGQQDAGEKGLSGVRVVTARGLIATTDEYGRFHITCAVVPDGDRGSNFILKMDERSLPSGYRATTENPRIQRATRGKMLRFNFGATIQRVVRLDIADGVFEPNTSKLRLQWTPSIARLIEELKKAPSVLRLSYLGDVEPEGLVHERLEALKKEIAGQWDRSEGGYRLAIETEVFWRRGAPTAGR